MVEPSPPSRPRRSWRFILFVTAGLVLVTTIAAFFVLRSAANSTSLADFGQSRRERRLAALRTYAARTELGSLLPQDDAVLAIREQFLQSAVTLSLPFRQFFNGGQYVARLDSATVRLESGLATVTLSGRGLLAGQENSPLYADLSLRGLLTVTGVDPDSGSLQASLVITDVHSRKAGSGGAQGLLNPVAHYFGTLKADDWNRTRQKIRLPLRIDQQIVLPEIEGDVSVPASRIPISVRVSSVTTLQGRMAISLALLPDSAAGERPAPAERRWNLRPRLPRIPTQWIRDLRHPDRLGAEEESLQVQVARLAGADPLWNAIIATDHDVVAIVPAPVLTKVVSRASGIYLKGVAVDLRPKATIKVDAALRVKLMDRKVGVGRFQGEIRISHLQGRLAVTGAPRLTFDPPNEVTVIAPVRLLAGHGNVDLNMKWAPAFLVGMVCRGFEFEEQLAGEILPIRDTLRTRIRYSIRDSVMLCQPRIERDTIRMSADLTEESWGRVRDKLVEQDRFGRCGMVMNADSALMKLRQLAGTGMNLHLPEKAFKPFRTPVVLENLYDSGPYRIEAMAFDPAVAVEPRFLRLAFRVNLRVSSLPQKPVPVPVAAATAAPRPKP